jgi:hypothetical protein
MSRVAGPIDGLPGEATGSWEGTEGIAPSSLPVRTSVPARSYDDVSYSGVKGLSNAEIARIEVILLSHICQFSLAENSRAAGR